MANEYINRDAVIELLVDKQRDICPCGRLGHGYVCGSDRDKYDEIEADIDKVQNIPAADVVPIVRCAECKHRPTIPDDYDPITTDGFVLDFPDEECPCRCGDGWYSKYLGDDWFCANGERKEEDEDESN